MKKSVSNIYIILIFLFLYLPILVFIFFSFNETNSRSVFTGFSLQWYQELFEKKDIMRALGNSLLVAAISSVAATVIGVIGATAIVNMKKRARAAVMNITYLPIINPEIVTGIALMLLFTFIAGLFHLELGMWSVTIAHITFSTPYVVLNVLPKLRQADASLFHAAQDLGCTPMQSFFKVILPEIMPGIMSGMLMAFTLSFDDFIISHFTSGSTFQTLPIAIYAMTKRKVKPYLNALFALIFVVVLVLLVLMNLKSIREAKTKERNL